MQYQKDRLEILPIFYRVTYTSVRCISTLLKLYFSIQNGQSGNFLKLLCSIFQAPQTLLNQSFWELIHYLTGDDVFDDLVRVRAIYRWITRFDIEAIEVGPEPQPDTPMEYFSKIQCDMGNIPNLFYILCTQVVYKIKFIQGSKFDSFGSDMYISEKVFFFNFYIFLKKNKIKSCHILIIYYLPQIV